MATTSMAIGTTPVDLTTAFSLVTGKSYTVQNTSASGILYLAEVENNDNDPVAGDASFELAVSGFLAIKAEGYASIWAWSHTDDGHITISEI